MLKLLRDSHRAIILGAAVAISLAPSPAAAQGLLDMFFGGAQRPAAPQSMSAYADPQTQAGPARPTTPRVETGPAVSYCVRLCDGRFFPIQRSAATPIEICNSFCPAARTKVFSGSTIEHAVAHDGSRYADLGSAYAFRTKVVPGCTCNGKDAFGLVDMKAADDPTLRAGDVVATNDGFVAYSGASKRSGDFTPIASAANLSPDTRRQLAQTPIRQETERASATDTINTSAAAREGNDRQAQLTK